MFTFIRVSTVRKHQGRTFFHCWEKVGGIVHKVSEFYFSLAIRCSKDFLVAKGNVFSKNVYEGIDFCGFIAGFIVL